MLVIGHRGAAGLAPENTFSSLYAAESSGVQMVEVDLRRTKDGQIVLMHDPALTRTHDDRRKVEDLTLAEISEIGERENREIPELTRFLQAVKMPINLELKVGGMEEAVLSAIKNFPHKVLISSHHPTVLKKIRALDEKIPLGFIIGQKMGYMFRLMMLIAKQLDLYSIHPYHTLINPSHMKMMREMKVKVYPWTVNNPHELLILKGFGIDGVFTDYPNIIK
jgi:glycerophosphoryl diester phosphodiesterase